MKWYYIPSALVFTLIVFSSVIIILSSDLAWSLTGEGLTYFVEVFKIPITLLGSLLVIASLTLAIYRAQRTDRQILFIEKNDFRSNFIELAKNHDSYDQHGIKIDLIANMSRLFPDLNNAQFNVNTNVFITLMDCIRIIDKGLDRKLNSDFSFLVGFSLLELDEKIESLKSELFVNHIERRADLKDMKYELIVKSKSILSLVKFLSNFEYMISVPHLSNITTELKKYEKMKSFIDLANKIIQAPTLKEIEEKGRSDRFLALVVFQMESALNPRIKSSILGKGDLVDYEALAFEIANERWRSRESRIMFMSGSKMDMLNNL